MARTTVPASWWPKAAISGLLGSVGLGIYMMFVSAATFSGWFTPLNRIATTFHAFRPYSHNFQIGPSLTGLVLHLVTGAFWGLVYGVILAFLLPPLFRSYDAGGRAELPEGASPGMFDLTRSYAGALYLGLIYGVVVYVMMGLWIGSSLAPALRAVEGATFLIGHLVYGVITTLCLYGWTRDREWVTISFAPEAPVEVEKPRR